MSIKWSLSSSISPNIKHLEQRKRQRNIENLEIREKREYDQNGWKIAVLSKPNNNNKRNWKYRRLKIINCLCSLINFYYFRLNGNNNTKINEMKRNRKYRKMLNVKYRKKINVFKLKNICNDNNIHNNNKMNQNVSEILTVDNNNENKKIDSTENMNIYHRGDGMIRREAIMLEVDDINNNNNIQRGVVMLWRGATINNNNIQRGAVMLWRGATITNNSVQREAAMLWREATINDTA